MKKVLQRLIETNMMQEAGYGADQFSQQAADKIREIIDCPHATVRFLVGGTQTNQVVISTVLEPYEAVISANTGHVAVHEGGAIEFSGHKVIELESNEGKITAESVKQYLETFNSDFKRTYGLSGNGLYITSYRIWYALFKSELQALSEVCRKHQIPLFMDGARLGYGVMSDATDVDITDIAKYCDIFYRWHKSWCIVR